MYVSIHFYHIELCLIRMISSDKKKYKKQDRAGEKADRSQNENTS